MKKLIFLLFLLLLLLFLFNKYNSFNINIFNTEKENVAVEKEVPPVEKKVQHKQQKKTPQTYFEIGKTHLKNKNFDMAISNFSKAIELDPNFIEAYKERALAKDRKKDFNGSQEDYKQYMLLLERQNKEEYEKAKQDIKNSVDEVRKKIVNKKYDEAIEDSNNIIETYPKYPNGYTIRADTYFSMQKYKSALDDYKKALSLSPGNKNFNLYLKLADTEYELELYKEAIDNYLKIINLNPNYEYAYYKLLGAYIFNENFNKALDILNEYTKISKTKNIQIQDYSQWTAVLNKYTENETIRDLKKDLKKLNFTQS